MTVHGYTVTVESDGTTATTTVAWPHRTPRAAMHEMLKIAGLLDDVDEQAHGADDSPLRVVR